VHVIVDLISQSSCYLQILSRRAASEELHRAAKPALREVKAAPVTVISLAAHLDILPEYHAADVRNCLCNFVNYTYINVIASTACLRSRNYGITNSEQ